MRIYHRKPKGSWYIDYRSPNGTRVRRKVGTSKKMAELALKEIELRMVKRKYLGIDEPQPILFDQLTQEYLGYSKANKGKRTHTNDVYLLGILLRRFTGKMVDDITVMDVEKYKNQRIAEVSGSTVNREISCLKHMFNKAVDWNYLPQNPLRSVKRFKEPPGRLRYLNDEDIEKLIDCCAEHLRPIVILALNTGMRKGEILNLKWQNIDLKNRIITLNETKNNELRTIPINDTLYAEISLMNRELGNQYVFSNGQGKPYTDIKRSFRTALKNAGIENFRFHDLRHTFASRLVMVGENLKTVKDLLGHKDIKMTMRYSHLSAAYKQDAVRKLDVGTNVAQQVKTKVVSLAKASK